MNKTILLTLLFAFTACETGTKYDANTTKVTNHHAIINLIERTESSDKDVVKRSYIEPNKQRFVKKEESFEPKTIDFIDRGFDYEAPVAVEDTTPPKPIQRVTEAVKTRAIDEPTEKEPILEELEETQSIAIQHFSGGIVSDGLNVKAIRVGRHATYTRLVFDIDKWIDVNKHGGTVNTVGSYSVDYNSDNTLVVVMDGYRGFSAKFPTFSSSSPIQKIYSNKYLDDSGFKFTIKLRGTSSIKVYNYKKPARLIIDIRPLL